MKVLRFLLLIVLIFITLSACSVKTEDINADRVVVEVSRKEADISPVRVITDPYEVQSIASLFSEIIIRPKLKSLKETDRICISFYNGGSLVKSVYYADGVAFSNKTGNFKLPDDFEHDIVRALPNQFVFHADLLSIANEYPRSFPDQTYYTAILNVRGMNCSLTVGDSIYFRNASSRYYEERKYKGSKYYFKEESISADGENGEWSESIETEILIVDGDFYYSLKTYDSKDDAKLSFSDLADVLAEPPEILQFNYVVSFEDAGVFYSVRMLDENNLYPERVFDGMSYSFLVQDGVKYICGSDDRDRYLLANTDEGVLFVHCSVLQESSSEHFESVDFSLLEKIRDICGFSFIKLPEKYCS